MRFINFSSIKAGLMLAFSLFLSTLLSGQSYWIHSTELRQGIRDTAMGRVIVDVNNNKWISTTLGLYRIGSDSTVDFYHANNSPVTGMGSRVITTGENGVLYVENGNELLVFNGSSWISYNSSNSNFSGGRISSMKFDAGVLWMTINNKGLVKLENGSFTYFNTGNSAIPSNSVARVNIDKKGNVWFSTPKPALVKFDGNTFTSFSTDKNGNSLPGILEIGFDNSGRVYAGTFYDGLLILENDAITNIKPNSDGFGVGHPTMATDGSMWFLTIYSNLLKFDGTTWHNFYANSDIETDAALFQYFAFDKYNNLWITTADKGLYILVDSSAVSISKTNDKKKPEFSVYPIPFQDKLNVKLEKPLNSDLFLTLIDITGKTIWEQRISAIGTDIVSISPANLKPGNYILRLNDGTDTNEILLTKCF